MESDAMFSNRFCQSKFFRCGGLVLALLIILGIFGAGLAEAKKKKKQKLPPPPDLQGKIDYYSWQLRGLHLDESGPLSQEIQNLVLDHLKLWMADRTPTSVEVRRELESIFFKVRYPITCKPAAFAEPWKGALLIGAGYSLGWTDIDRVNTVALFENREGKSRLAAVTNFIPRADVRYEFVKIPGVDDFRFFVYGLKLGKSHPRLAAVLYSYDGQTLKSLWQTDDVYDGKMIIEGDQVVIRFLKEEEYIREVAHRRKPPRYEATYRIAPQGLELQTQREIPF
jgi:hypothetical protein